jgi:hypothetical protein
LQDGLHLRHSRSSIGSPHQATLLRISSLLAAPLRVVSMSGCEAANWIASLARLVPRDRHRATARAEASPMSGGVAGGRGR